MNANLSRHFPKVPDKSRQFKSGTYVRIQFKPEPIEEQTYPGVGLLITLGTSFLFWGSLGYILFH